MIVSYRRASTDDQLHGPMAQSDRIEAWAKANNVTIEQDFFDDAVSGSVPLAKRGQGAAMLDTLKQEASEKIVVVAKLDRLFRSVADAAITLEDWSNAGIKLIALAENFDMTSSFGRAMAQVASVFAELERAMIRERTSAALQAKRLRGERLGTVPYGWDSLDGTLIENTREQEMIAEMKLLRNCLFSTRMIAARFNKLGIPAKRGGNWSPSTVSKILKRKETGP